jgi:hypothetical protein
MSERPIFVINVIIERLLLGLRRRRKGRKEGKKGNSQSCSGITPRVASWSDFRLKSLLHCQASRGECGKIIVHAAIIW